MIVAEDWIKWVKGLPRRREVIVLARKLNMSAREAACCCMEVWEWADDNTTNGHIAGVSSADIDNAIGVPGFGVAMSDPEVDWLRENSRGISFPRWDRNNGETAKKRALEARKKRRQRELDKKGPSRKCPADVPKRAGPEREKSVLEIERGAGASCTGTKPPTGSCLDTPQFAEAWGKLMNHTIECSENGKGITPTMAEAWLMDLARMGHDKAMEVVNHSIRVSHRGYLFEPREWGKKSKSDAKPVPKTTAEKREVYVG